MFNSTDYKVLCRDCNTVYPLKQIAPTRDFSNFQHVALPFFEEHCSTTMKFALIAPALSVSLSQDPYHHPKMCTS